VAFKTQHFPQDHVPSPDLTFGELGLNDSIDAYCSCRRGCVRWYRNVLPNRISMSTRIEAFRVLLKCAQCDRQAMAKIIINSTRDPWALEG
jgi:hypothetical protein